MQASGPSGVAPVEVFVVQHAGQFMVEGLVKFPEELTGGWKHTSQDPVCPPPGVGFGPFVQRCLPLLRKRTCSEDVRRFDYK